MTNNSTLKIRWVGYICNVIGIVLFNCSLWGWLTDPSHMWRHLGLSIWLVGTVISGYGLIRFTRESSNESKKAIL
jgi:type II secretory pathway component PulF